MSEKIEDTIRTCLSQYRRHNVNAAWFVIGRYSHEKPDALALHVVTSEERERSYTFGELDVLSAKLSAGLAGLGVEPGDRVAALLPKGLELTLTALATWRLGAVYVPLFTAFGNEAVSYRLNDSETKVVVTDANNRGKLVASAANSLRVIVTVNDASRDDMTFDGLLTSSPRTEWTTRNDDDPMILLYTSGTTGQPKGVVVPVWALAAFETYMRLGLDVNLTDQFWNLADPGWAYGLYYGLIGPLLLGQATFVYQGAFDPQNIVGVLKRYHITNFAAAPTAFRAIRAASIPPQKTSLRVISSAGEPLNPEISQWSEKVFNRPIYDHYGQTELGMVINNHHDLRLDHSVQPGSMGIAMPGFRVVIVDDEGVELNSEQKGHLAIDTESSPLFWFTGYYKAAERTQERFTKDGRYYLTGDDAWHDDAGYFYFIGRSDDIILSAGYRIGPFEVENILMAHPSVAECAVIGIPDELRGELVKAHIVLRNGYRASRQLESELQEWVRQRLAKTAYPREMVFVDVLPKTPSGKIQRYRLRNE